MRKRDIIKLVFFLCGSAVCAKPNSVTASQAILKTPFPVKSLCWTDDDNRFAFSEDNLIFIRDAESVELIQTVPMNDNRYIQFATPNTGIPKAAAGETNALRPSGRGSTEFDMMFTLSGRGNISLLKISKAPAGYPGYIQPTTVISLDSGRNTVTAALLSQNGDYIAVADESCRVTLYYMLRYSNNLLSMTLEGHSRPVYSLSFSPDSTLLASTSEDNTVKVWETKTGEFLGQFRILKKNRVPTLFTHDSKRLICCTNDCEVTVFNLPAVYNQEAEAVKSIETLSPVKSMKLLNNSSILTIQTTDNRIEFHDLTTDEYIGYIPSYNISELTSYAFSSDNRQVLAGYSDGSIYRFIVSEVLLKPDETPPKLMFLADNEIAVGGSRSNSSDNSDSSTARKNVNSKFENSDGIIPFVGAKLLKDPFCFSIKGGLEYINGTIFQPVLFGAGIKAEYGYPVEDFPYVYKVAGVVAESPHLPCIEIYAPVGMIFKLGYGFMIPVYLQAGFKLTAVSMSYGGRLYISKLYPTFSAGLFSGVMYGNFEIRAGVEYDPIAGICPMANVGYRIKLGKTVNALGV